MSDQTVFNVMDDLLAALSDEVEARRLDLLRGRRLLIVMGFDEGNLPLYQRAQALGVKFRVIASKKDREDNGGQKVGPNVRDRNHEFERVLSGLAGHTSAGTV